MPIHIINPPEQNFRAVQPILQYFAKEDQAHEHLIPHAIYDASVTLLAEGADLEHAQQTGWRYVFQETNGGYFVAEVGMDEALDEHKFHHLNQGGNLQTFLSFYHKLHDHQHVEERGYQINLLRISPLHVKAIWLKGVDHAHEFFISLTPANGRLEVGGTYEYEHFMAVLQETARELLGGLQ